MTTLRMYGTAPESIVDGPGLRFSVFVQGCTHHCPGCHNPESQPSDGGYLCEPADIVHEVHKNKLIHGVTLTGGEPFEQVEGVFELAQLLKAEGYDLNWVGSSNQRVIDLPATLKSGEVVLWKQDTIDFEAPSSW